MLQKTVDLGNQKVTFKSSAAIPRLYRAKFGRDIFKDISKLEQAYKANAGKEASGLQVEDLELFENVAYIMALHADPSIPDTIDGWLENYEMFSIYKVLPEILELWGENLVTTVDAKKNGHKPKGK